MDCFATLAMTKKQSEEITMAQSAKRVVLASRPVGEPKTSDFRIEDYALPTPGEGQVLLRAIWLSLDPYMRGRMSEGPSYAAPRSEEHTSELQSRQYLVCRLLLEK